MSVNAHSKVITWDSKDNSQLSTVQQSQIFSPEQIHFSGNLALVNLTNEQMQLAKNIRSFEIEIFENNRESFSVPSVFSKLAFSTKVYYLRRFVFHIEPILDLSAFYQNKSDQCPEMIPFFYERISQITQKKNLFYDNSDHLDLYTISDWKYRSLLWQNLRLIKSMSFSEFSGFVHSFSQIHKRENGRILGKDYFDRIARILLQKAIHVFVRDQSNSLTHDLQDFGIFIQGVKNIPVLHSLIIAQPDLVQLLVNVCLDCLTDFNFASAYPQTVILSFLSETLNSFVRTTTNSPIIEFLITANSKAIGLFTENSDLLVNPATLPLITDSCILLSELIPQNLIVDFVLKAKKKFNAEIIKQINVSDISQFTTLLVKIKLNEVSLFSKIRKQIFHKFEFFEQISANDLLTLLGNLAYLEFRNKYSTELFSDDLLDFSNLFYLKNTFKMFVYQKFLGFSKNTQT